MSDNPLNLSRTPVEVPFITEELKQYIIDLFGSKVAQNYFKAISKPMEEYTLHFFNNYDSIDDTIVQLSQIGFLSHIHPNFPNIVSIERWTSTTRATRCCSISSIDSCCAKNGASPKSCNDSSIMSYLTIFNTQISCMILEWKEDP